MSASVARVGDALRVGSRWAWLVATVLLCGVVAVVALATRLGMLPALVALAFVALLTVVSFRWPLLSLLVFAALIPIEEVAVIEGFGTISRFAGILFAVTYGLPRLGRLALGAMPLAGWAFLAWAILSVGWALDPAIAGAELLTLLQLFVIALLVADLVAQRPAIVRPVLWVYSLSAAATALIGTLTFIASDTRAAALENQNPAQFAAVLLPALIFGLYEMLNGERRILGGAIALVTTVGVVVSGTRGAWLAVGVALLLFILPQLRPRQRLAAIAASVILVVLAYQVPGVAGLVAERAGNAISTGGAGRTDIWSVSLTIYKSAPVIGVGYANFPVAYTSEVVRASGVGRYTLTGAGPHNLVVGTLVELGPLGLLLLALFVGPLLLRRGWGPDAATVQAALASIFVMALFLDILGNRKQVWLVIGLAGGLAYVGRQMAEKMIANGHPGAPGTDSSPAPGADGPERLPGNVSRLVRRQ